MRKPAPLAAFLLLPVFFDRGRLIDLRYRPAIRAALFSSCLLAGQAAYTNSDLVRDPPGYRRIPAAAWRR
jgi:hypothetical protein